MAYWIKVAGTAEHAYGQDRWDERRAAWRDDGVQGSLFPRRPRIERGDRLVVYAAGDDASLILPRFAAGKRFIVQVVINSPVETTAQLYYLTNGQTKYRESQSQIAKLVPSRNVVYFRVDAPNVIDPIRFDPSAAPGEYTIESMTAMGLPRGGTP